MFERSISQHVIHAKFSSCKQTLFGGIDIHTHKFILNRTQICKKTFYQINSNKLFRLCGSSGDPTSKKAIIVVLTKTR